MKRRNPRNRGNRPNEGATISSCVEEPIKRISSATKIAPHNQKVTKRARRQGGKLVENPGKTSLVYYIRQMLKRVIVPDNGGVDGGGLTLKCCACSSANKFKNKIRRAA